MLSYDVIEIESANPLESDKSYDLFRRRAINIFNEKHPRVTPVAVIEQRGRKEIKPNDENTATWWTAKTFTLLVYYNDPDWVMPSADPTVKRTTTTGDLDPKKRGRPKKNPEGDQVI